MNKNSIDQTKCKKCKLCIEVCPVHCIGVDTDGAVNFIHHREDICLQCGHCMAICRTEAVSIQGYSYQENFFPLPRNTITDTAFMDFIASRRSIRNYRNKAVHREVINKILDSVRFAPYGAEPDNVEITIINNRTIIEHALPYIAEFMDSIVQWIDNPIARFMIKQKIELETFNTIKNHLYPMAKMGNYKLKYGDSITRNAPVLMIFHAAKGAEEHTNNAMIYASYAMLTAHAYGLGALMNGIVPAAINKVSAVRKIFSIPDTHEAVITVLIGYPKYTFSKSIRRRKKKTHWIE